MVVSPGFRHDVKMIHIHWKSGTFRRSAEKVPIKLLTEEKRVYEEILTYEKLWPFRKRTENSPF